MAFTNNGKLVRRFATRSEVVAAEMRPTATEVGGPMANIGNVAPQRGGEGSAPLPETISFELDNSAGVATAIFIIGDPSGLIAVQNGGTLLAPTGCSADGAVKGSGVAAMKALFATQPLALRGFNYKTSSDPAQFDQKLTAVYAQVQGAFMRVPLNVAINQRNNAQNDLLMTLDLVQPYVLNNARALTLAVIAGEVVNLEMSLFAA